METARDRLKLLLRHLDRTEDAPVLNCLRDLYPRLQTAPASAKQQYYAAYPGGLLDHMLTVAEMAIEMRCGQQADIPERSIVKAALLHDIGKVGDADSPYFIPVESTWLRERGHLFDVNPALTPMTLPFRTAWWLARYAVQLSPAEWQASMYCSVWATDAWQTIQYYEDPLTLLVASAKTYATRASQQPMARR